MKIISFEEYEDDEFCFEDKGGEHGNGDEDGGHEVEDEDCEELQDL